MALEITQVIVQGAVIIVGTLTLGNLVNTLIEKVFE